MYDIPEYNFKPYKNLQFTKLLIIFNTHILICHNLIVKFLSNFILNTKYFKDHVFFNYQIIF